MRVVICIPDSEERAFCRRRINVLAKLDGITLTIDEVKTAGIGNSYFNLIDFEDTDLIYIGVNSQFNGIAVAKSIRKAGINAEIIFFTRFKSAVFDAFDVGALHYLVSGEISVAKFDEVFRRAVSKAEYRTQASIVLSCAGEQRKIVISQIYYFEVFNRIVKVHYRDGTFEFYSTLSKLEDGLARRGFVRVHRAYLVSERFIAKINRREITLTDGTTIPIGGKYINNIQLQGHY
jgi:DNA-binding LytR/AlgR family response regulator